MDHAEIEQQQIVDRYLLGQLPPEEAERFEVHYLSCSECLEELEAGEQLIAGLRRSTAREAARVAVQAGIFAWLARLQRSRQLGIAVMMALVLLLPSGLLVERLMRGPGPGGADGLAPQINTPFVSLSPLRGEGGEPVHRLRPPAAGWVVLSLELDLPQHDRYRAALLDPGGEVLWQGEGLVPDLRDALVVSLPARLLAPGDYRVAVEGDPSAGEPVPVATFSFRVLPHS